MHYINKALAAYYNIILNPVDLKTSENTKQKEKERSRDG